MDGTVCNKKMKSQPNKPTTGTVKRRNILIICSYAITFTALPQTFCAVPNLPTLYCMFCSLCGNLLYFVFKVLLVIHAGNYLKA